MRIALALIPLLAGCSALPGWGDSSSSPTTISDGGGCTADAGSCRKVTKWCGITCSVCTRCSNGVLIEDGDDCHFAPCPDAGTSAPKGCAEPRPADFACAAFTFAAHAAMARTGHALSSLRPTQTDNAP